MLRTICRVWSTDQKARQYQSWSVNGRSWPGLLKGVEEPTLQDEYGGVWWWTKENIHVHLAGCGRWWRWVRKHKSSPVVVHLVDYKDVVADVLLVEEGVHEGNEHQQLIKALSEGDNQGQLVRSPGEVVQSGSCLFLHRTGLVLVLGGAPVVHGASATGRYVPRAAELEQDEGNQD